MTRLKTYEINQSAAEEVAEPGFVYEGNDSQHTPDIEERAEIDPLIESPAGKYVG